MNGTIVNAQQRMIEQLEAIEQSCFSLPMTAQQLASQLPDDRHVLLVYAEGERVLGYVGMMYVLDEGYISNVAVAGEYRRQGIADSLLKALDCEALRLKLSFVTLEVRVSNHAAVALYKKHGYVKVGLRRNYYDKPKEDAILMTKFYE